MRPSTDYELVTAVLHELRDVDHDWHPSCCGAEPHDRLEAVDLVDAIRERGAHISFDLAPREIAASGKRETSRKAAAIADLRGGMKGVYELVACHGSHGLTDDEITEQYAGFAERNGFARIAADSPRKRRQNLSEAGYLIDSGRTRATRCGNDAIVWVAREAQAVAA